MGSGNSENESVLNICTFEYMYKYSPYGVQHRLFKFSRHTYSIPNCVLILYLFDANRVPQPWDLGGSFPHRTLSKLYAIAPHELHCFFHRRRWVDHSVNRHTQSLFRVRQKENAYICPLVSKSRWRNWSEILSLWLGTRYSVHGVLSLSHHGVESRVAAVGPGCLLGSEIPGRAWIKPWRGSRADGILSRVKHWGVMMPFCLFWAERGNPLSPTILGWAVLSQPY